jgi:UDP-2,3-diacylglucosamine pyrophosphatase LpxH
MLILVSDIHLTDRLKGPSVSRAEHFDRFWVRIDAARGEAPAHLCFVGDLFDIVRSPLWHDSEVRPYHAPSPAQERLVERIAGDILAREQPFLERVRARVAAGELVVHYVLGNHDRLLAHAPAARRAIAFALRGREEPADFPAEMVFPDHGVLAFHGHTTDFICHEPDGGPPIGDAIASDLIVRFPRALRARLGAELPELDDIDDVRPIFAVPAWVRYYAVRQKGVLAPVGDVWRGLVEDFLENGYVRDWMHAHSGGALSEGGKLKLLLQLSTGRFMRKTKDARLGQVYRFFQHFFDGRFARRAAELLDAPAYRGLRFVVNGHSHFSSMTPLGQVDGRPACYFNTGTWRTVHQMGRGADGAPAFLPYEAMTYLCFFPSGDRLGRDFEWWTGALVSNESLGS